MDLNLADLDISEISPAQALTPPPPLRLSVQRLRAAHHKIARLLAAGTKQTEIATLCAVTPATVQNLSKDPAFQSLVQFYAEREDARFDDVRGKLKDLSYDAVAELHDRVVGAPDELSDKALLDIAQLGLDRTGHGPSSNVNVSSLKLSPEDLALIKGQAPKEKVINAEVLRERAIKEEAPDETAHDQSAAKARNAGRDGRVAEAAAEAEIAADGPSV